MGACEYSTVFHPRGNFRRKFLEEIDWKAEELSDFVQRLVLHAPRPETLFLDLFVNAFTAIPDANQEYSGILWWRERAPALPLDKWYSAALGYALAAAIGKKRETLIVDFWERELDNEDLLAAISATSGITSQGLPMLWICWSQSVLQNWQQEGLTEAADREAELTALFSAVGAEPVFVPVTDPLGAILAARKMVAAPVIANTVKILILPAFGNDKLVHAHWHMKTIARYQAGMEAIRNDSITSHG